jgi:hypothetical protein
MTDAIRYKDRPFAHEMQDVSLDIETLSRKGDAVVVSVGIATYDDGPNFYEHFNAEEQMGWNRHIEAEAIIWHMQKHPKQYARDVAKMARAVRTLLVFNKIDEFIVSLKYTPRVWMNSPRFDGDILQSLALDAGLSGLPWEYWQECDLRTIRTCAELRNANEYAQLPDPPKDAHDALADAIYQLEIISRCKTILNC